MATGATEMIKHVSAESTRMLMTWLLNHEDDIANDINDFGDLYLIFKEMIGHHPYIESGTGLNDRGT